MTGISNIIFKEYRERTCVYMCLLDQQVVLPYGSITIIKISRLSMSPSILALSDLIKRKIPPPLFDAHQFTMYIPKG